MLCIFNENINKLSETITKTKKNNTIDELKNCTIVIAVIIKNAKQEQTIKSDVASKFKHLRNISG